MRKPMKNKSWLITTLYATCMLAMLVGLGYAVTFRQDAQQSVQPR